MKTAQKALWPDTNQTPPPHRQRTWTIRKMLGIVIGISFIAWAALVAIVREAL